MPSTSSFSEPKKAQAANKVNGTQRAERNALVFDPHLYKGSRFSDVWQTLSADPYSVLPEDRVGFHSIATWLKNAALLRAARRTLDTGADLLPPFRKLVHTIGISLRGTWRITEQTPYTGYFASGQEALIIARASDALGETRPGKLRFLGIAGKLYPTTDADHQEPLKTANFFVFENIGGSHTKRFTEASLTNDLLPVEPHPGAALKAPLGNILGPAFAIADKTIDPTQLMIRQLYPIAELGEQQPEQARGPRFLKLVGGCSGEGPETSDLRKELEMHNHPDGIRFEIQVADKGPRMGDKSWRKIGEVRFTDSVASAAGDTQLHFAHPKFEKGRGEVGLRNLPSMD